MKRKYSGGLHEEAIDQLCFVCGEIIKDNRGYMVEKMRVCLTVGEKVAALRSYSYACLFVFSPSHLVKKLVRTCFELTQRSYVPCVLTYTSPGSLIIWAGSTQGLKYSLRVPD